MFVARSQISFILCYNEDPSILWPVIILRHSSTTSLDDTGKIWV